MVMSGKSSRLSFSLVYSPALVVILLLSFLFSWHPNAHANDFKRSFCIFDVAGANGPLFDAAKDIRLEAMGWGNYEIELLPYTNESVLNEDFKSGKCDAATLTGIRSRSFNKFIGSVDSPGGVLDYEQFKLLHKVLNHPKYHSKISNDRYELAGISPLGMAYVFVNDRAITSIAKAAGKRVAMLEFDPVQAKIVSQVGATPVASSLVDFTRKFNNGVVDIIAAPAAAFSVFELYRGIDPNGGIVRYPLTILTAQLLVHKNRFTPEFLVKSREYSLNNFERATKIIAQEVAKIDEKYWIDIPENEKPQYEGLMQELRVQLRDEGYFDAEMMRILRKIRCKSDRTRAECVNPVE